MSDSTETAERILDMLDVEHSFLRDMIAEAIDEAEAAQRDRIARIVERRLAVARHAAEQHPRRTYIHNIIHTLEELLEAIKAA
jgi:hypothetical protein